MRRTWMYVECFCDEDNKEDVGLGADLVLDGDCHAKFSPLIQLLRFTRLHIHTTITIRAPKAIVPVGAMDHGTLFGEVEIPRDAGEVVGVGRDAGNGTLHITGGSFAKDGKDAAGCWSKFASS